MPKKKQVRRKIKAVKTPTIDLHEKAIADLDLINESPQGRLLVEQDLSDVLSSAEYTRGDLFTQQEDGDSINFVKVDLVWGHRYPEFNEEPVAIISKALLSYAIETIIELDRKVDFLQSRVSKKAAPTLKKVLAMHKRRLTAFNKLAKKSKRGKKK